MKALIILLTGPAMLFFTLAAASTAEWCAEQGYPVPWAQLAGIVAMDIAWCVTAGKCRRESLNEALEKCEKFIDKLFINHS